jgi:dihydroneopterin aldolase
LLEWERTTCQTLSVEVSLNLDLEGATAGDLARSVNYATTLAQVEFVARRGHWVLLESMGAAILRLLLASPAPGEPRTVVSHAIVRLQKPDVLEGRAIPTVELSRSKSWLQLIQLPTDVRGATVEVLQLTPETGAFRIQLEPGTHWSVPPETACMVVSGQVDSLTDRLSAGAVLEPGGHSLRCVDAVCLIAVARARAAGKSPDISGVTGDYRTTSPDGGMDATPAARLWRASRSNLARRSSAISPVG